MKSYQVIWHIFGVFQFGGFRLGMLNLHHSVTVFIFTTLCIISHHYLFPNFSSYQTKILCMLNSNSLIPLLPSNYMLLSICEFVYARNLRLSALHISFALDLVCIVLVSLMFSRFRCAYGIFCSHIHLLMDIWSVSTFWILWNMLQIYKCACYNAQICIGSCFSLFCIAYDNLMFNF